MVPVSADFLARFLGDLQRSFGAEILDARDDLDGAIWVDVRVDAGRARKMHRLVVRQQAEQTFVRSQEILERSASLQRRAIELMGLLTTERDDMSEILAADLSSMREVRELLQRERERADSGLRTG